MVFHMSRASPLVKYGLPLLLILWSLAYLTPFSIPYGISSSSKDEKALFESEYLAHEIDGQFDGSGIDGLCAVKNWTPGLVLSCEPPTGGVGRVKNAHLNCIRFAIEMGSELILPGIIKRSDKDIRIVSPDYRSGPRPQEPLSYFWDHEYLKYTLATHCPQMKVYNSIDDLYDVPSMLTAHNIGLREMKVPLKDGGVIAEIEKLQEKIKAYVEKLSPPKTRERPVRFHLGTTYFAWPTANDTPTLGQNWGRILRPRADARRLAATALFNIQKRFDLNLDPRQGLHKDSFLGIHLRSEADALDSFPPYERQAAYYLDYSTKSRYSVAFLATGATQDNITAFTERAKDFGLTVVAKKDILEADVAAMKMLTYDFTWDQRALVDYEIMLRAGLVLGASESSFAWNLAMRRTNAYGGFNRNMSDVATEGYVQWHDEYSMILGTSDRGKTMRQTIWP